MPTKYHVISHTHWDREWYQPLENMKLRLIDLFDHMLEILQTQPEYRFHLDAQTIVLEDYLSVRPQKRAELEKYISEGRVLVGPWYVQNDFYLTSGEATVRNLLIGMDIADEFGKCTLVGYCADQFGVIAQLPQIYRQFGIDSCIFGRGYNFSQPKESDFYWRSEDGSEVLCEFMTFWYNNAQRFPANVEKSMAMLRFIDGNLRKTCRTDEYLLMNGVDHLEAQEDLLPILHKMNEQLTDGSRIFQSTMPEFMEALSDAVKSKELTQYTGEMRNGGVWNLLAGTLSSRVYLKQHNTRCQMMLERQLEPLYSVLSRLGVKEYPQDYLHYLWKTLIQNHAHDSICGCSVDEVHRNMVDRFSRVETGAQDMLSRGMELLCEAVDRSELSPEQYLFTVFNPIQETRTQAVEFVAEFPMTEEVQSFAITDNEGNPAEFRVISHEPRAKGVVTPINLPGVVNVDAYRVLLSVKELPGLTYRTYVITPSQQKKPLQPAEASAQSVLENRFLRAEILPNGTVNLLQKENGVMQRGLFLLEDEPEIGDSYVHFDLENCPHITSENANASIVLQTDGKQRQRAKVEYSIFIPDGYSESKKCRSNHMVELPVCLELTLEEESRFLSAAVTIKNYAADHRVRMKFPTGIVGDISFSGNPFDVTARSSAEAHLPDHVADQPNSEFVAVDGTANGVAIFNNGLQEYEHCGDGTILITLLRCEEYISHDPYGKAEMVEDKWRAKESQCIGTHTLELAVYPYTGNHRSARVAQLARCFNTPLLCCCQPVDRHKFAGGRPFVQGSDTPEFFFRQNTHVQIPLNADRPFCAVEDPSGAMVLSAVKRAEHDERILLRLYNTASESVLFALRFGEKPPALFRSDLQESDGTKIIPDADGGYSVFAKPKAIVTVAIQSK